MESADRVELDHDTKGEAGLVEIVATIFKKIDDCEVFVADITPVAAISSNDREKKIPNPNVMIELGYALRELGHQRVIAVENLAFGGEPEELPFDLRHRRGAITYSLMEIDDPSVEDKRTALVQELAAALKTNLAAPREDRMIKNPQPVLSLEASEEMPAVALVEQNATLEGIRTLADIMNETPVQSKADQAKPESAFQIPIYEDIFSRPRTRRKPFREWTEEELDGYNKRVQRYYERYTEYLEAVKQHGLHLQRAITVKLVLANRGTLSATDVRSCIQFPPGVLAYEDGALPMPPEPPSPPPFVPNGFSTTTVVQSGYSWNPEPHRTASRIANDHKSVVFHTSKLQHHYQQGFDSFTLLFSSKDDIKSFDAEYYITTDQLPTPQKGKLHFEVELSGR
ncbi:hypothetical protein [Paraburkholderia sp. GAS32]|uniref:hypothetical protein n=1 Tax=Paraburkholderia sp. GAS32 TaxID=3035129 RepID=UPI003D1FCBD6